MGLEIAHHHLHLSRQIASSTTCIREACSKLDSSFATKKPPCYSLSYKHSPAHNILQTITATYNLNTSGPSFRPLARRTFTLHSFATGKLARQLFDLSVACLGRISMLGRRLQRRFCVRLVLLAGCGPRVGACDIPNGALGWSF